MDILVRDISNNNIDVLDERTLLLEESKDSTLGFDLTDVFCHTDLHMKTDAEIWAANKIGNYINRKYNIPVNNMEYLSTSQKFFSKKSYPFLGNYGRNIGLYYTELDRFDIYKPRFETDFTMNIWDNGIKKDGSFENVIMNGYENLEHNEYTYWVVNYLNYTQPYYTVKNNKQNGGKLLVITDSIGYRTLGHLALSVEEITVLDPRFFNGEDYITRALSDRSYDIVIVQQGTFLTNNLFCIK